MGTGSGGRETVLCGEGEGANLTLALALALTLTVLCGEGEGGAPSRVACSGWRSRLEQRLQCATLITSWPCRLAMDT